MERVEISQAKCPGFPLAGSYPMHRWGLFCGWEQRNTHKEGAQNHAHRVAGTGVVAKNRNK